ncbi:MAG: hypothetical protein EP330_13930 [Deltaproteobacteria bacterium]|nr:MAG: hypothetical protein EP330_13930 [Deltaproteobacteria bacterium]
MRTLLVTLSLLAVPAQAEDWQDCSDQVSVHEDVPPALACAPLTYDGCYTFELTNRCTFDVGWETSGPNFVASGTLMVTDTGQAMDATTWMGVPVGEEYETETYAVRWWSLDDPDTAATRTFQVAYVYGGPPRGCRCSSAPTAPWWALTLVGGLAVLRRKRRSTPGW